VVVVTVVVGTRETPRGVCVFFRFPCVDLGTQCVQIGRNFVRFLASFIGGRLRPLSGS
jgi:hypothetical protein